MGTATDLRRPRYLICSPNKPAEISDTWPEADDVPYRTMSYSTVGGSWWHVCTSGQVKYWDIVPGIEYVPKTYRTALLLMS